MALRDDLGPLLRGLSDEALRGLVDGLPEPTVAAVVATLALDDLKADVFRQIDELEDMAIAAGDLDGPDPSWDRARNRRRR